MEELHTFKIHPLSLSIYGEDALPQDFLDSLAKNGFIHSIVVSKLSGKVVSGSRRYRACVQLGIRVPSERYPVIYRDFDNELEEEQFLIEANKQREKTFSQRMLEVEHLKRILGEQARKNSLANLRKGKQTTFSEVSKTDTPGKTQNIIAKEQRISTGKLSTSEKIWNKAKLGDRRAIELVGLLDSHRTTVGSAGAVLRIYEGREKQEVIARVVSRANEIPKNIRFGDCLKLMPELPSKSINAAITSPPFQNKIAGVKTDQEYYVWFEGVLEKLERITNDYALILNSATRLTDICNLKRKPIRILIWNKGIIQGTFRYEPIFVYRFASASYNINNLITHDVFTHQPPQSQGRPHVYENPVGLYVDLLKCLAGESVIDPFLGSGTLFRASRVIEQKKWKVFGFEKDESLRSVIAESVGP